MEGDVTSVLSTAETFAGEEYIVEYSCTGRWSLVGAGDSVICESCNTLQVRMSQVCLYSVQTLLFLLSARKVLVEGDNPLA